MKRLISALLCACLLLLPGCGQKEPEPMEERLLDAAFWTAPDGAVVSRWDVVLMNREVFRLEDGTELLNFTPPVPPSNVGGGGVEGFRGLSETAQEKVLSFYEQQGLLFDLRELVAAAYADYLDCQSRTEENALDFRYHHATQEVGPVSETARYTTYVTEIWVPRDAHFDGTVDMIQTCQLFDRQTGERLDPWALFSVPKDEALRYIFYEVCDDWEIPQREGLMAALKNDQIFFYRECLELDYPRGSLTGKEFKDYANGFAIGIEYGDLLPILHEWAIPEQADQTALAEENERDVQYYRYE